MDVNSHILISTACIDLLLFVSWVFSVRETARYKRVRS